MNVHPQISLALLSLTTSSLLTSLSTSSKRPSHSAQHSPPPTSPTSYHLCNTLAVRTRSSEIVSACSSWLRATRSSCGCSWMSAAEVWASGIGRSLSEVSREAVSGNAEVYERTIDARFWVVSVSGIVEGGVGRKRSGKRSSRKTHNLY